MCEIVTATTLAYAALGISAVGAGASIMESRQQTKDAEDTAQNQAEEFATERDQKLGERIKEARRERARIRVGAGESGVAGASFEAQLKNSFGQENQDIAVIKKQGGFTQRSINTNAKSNSGRFGGLQAGLQIAGGAISAKQGFDASKK